MKLTTQIVAGQRKSRLIGVIYLLYFVFAFAAAFLLEGMLTASGPDAVAGYFRTHEMEVQAGAALDLMSNAFYLTLAVLLYNLFKTVEKRLAQLAVVFSLAGCAAKILGCIFQATAFQVFMGPVGYNFDEHQWTALASLLLEGERMSLGVALPFFGLFNLLIGLLVWKCGFLPKFLGTTLFLAGFGWLAFLFSPFGRIVYVVSGPLGLFGELLLMLWLLIRGVPVRVTETDRPTIE